VGKRGPRPLPSALKLLRGRPHRATRDRKEPQLGRSDQSDPPDQIKGRAAKEWRRLYDHLVEAGVLTVGDERIFEEYCYVWGELVRVKAAIKDMPVEVAIMKGLTKLSTTLRQQLMQLSDRLGLNPSARSGVKAVEPKKEESKLARFLIPVK